MKLTTPKVYIVGNSKINHKGMDNWLTDLGVDYELDEDATDGENLIKASGKRCYMSFDKAHNNNIAIVREDTAAFIDNILKVGHGSVIEHVSYTFAVEGVSRVFTAEINRHRAGTAVSEGSGRFISTNELTAIMPLEFEISEGDSYEIIKKKERSRDLVSAAYIASEHYAKELRQVWADELAGGNFGLKKKLTSAVRSIYPMRQSTGGVWTGNLRALRHIFTMRCDPAAESEICHVASLMLEAMMEAEPLVFADFEKIDGYYKPKYRKV